MLDINFHRRNFVSIGGLGAMLSVLPFANVAWPEEHILTPNDKAVVWLWLAGGPTQFETFHAPTDSSPESHRPIAGSVTHPNGLAFGGLFNKLIKRGDKLTAINSFSHEDSSHRQATQWMMTGHKNPKRDQTANPEYPSYGSIVSAVFGSNHPVHGMPSYVKQGNIVGEQPAFLGGDCKPFDPSNKDNLIPKVQLDRFKDRKNLLSQLDRATIVSPTANSFRMLGDQAYNTILGNAKDAFDLEKEPEAMRNKYGKNNIGNQLLLARRLAQFGTKFITISYGGWDMHQNIKKSLERRVPPLDKALAAFVDDIYARGMNKDTLLIVTGDFGRTKLNGKGGRDHWPAITPMLMSGGDYPHGRVIGSADKGYYPKSNKVVPLDVAATLFNHFGIPTDTQKVDQGGRPRYLLEGEAKSIL